MISSLDHLVLTVRDINTTIDFYTRVLGMDAISFGNGRQGLKFGQQKINLHQAGQEFEPKAARPIPGSADLCFLASIPLEKAIQQIEAKGIPILAGPLQRTGATGPIQSVYIRDPDENLIEIAVALS